MAETTVAKSPELTADEKRVISDAQARTQAQMARIGQPGVHYKTLAEAAKYAVEMGEPTVTAMVPKQFVLTLDGVDQEQIKFEKGVQQVPKALMDHWYVKANKVEVYSAPISAPKMEPILGSQGFTKDVIIGGKTLTAGEVNIAAFQASGLTPAQWNGLTDDQRGEQMLRVLDAKEAAAAAASPAEPKPAVEPKAGDERKAGEKPAKDKSKG